MNVFEYAVIAAANQSPDDETLQAWAKSVIMRIVGRDIVPGTAEVPN